MIRRSALTSTLLFGALAVAACQSGDGATTAPGATSSAAAPGSLSTPVPATQPPLPTAAPGFSFSLPSVDKALEDLLPDQVAGATVSKSSMAGESLVGGSDSDLSQVLDALDKTPDDISAAFGAGGGVSISAYRLKGVEATTLLTAFVRLLSAEETPVVSDASIGGKAVKQVVSDGDTTYVYTHEDVLFTVAPIGSGKDAAVSDAISKLP